MSIYFSELGKRGGKARWSKAKRGAMKKHMEKMTRLSREKRNPQSKSKDLKKSLTA